MCNIIPAVLNIVLDWWFVFPLGMGVRGAALATAIAGLTGGSMALIYFRRSYILKFTRSITNFRKTVATQARIGSAAFVTEIAMSIMMFTGNYVFMKYFGESGVAAYSIACYLFPLIFMMNNAVAQSAQPIISYNYGSGNKERVKGALWIAFIGYWQSIKKAALAFALTLLRGVVLLVPLFLLLPLIFPKTGMWAAIPASELLTLIVIIAVYGKEKR